MNPQQRFPDQERAESEQRAIRKEQRRAMRPSVGAVSAVRRRVAVERTTPVNTAARLVDTPPAISDT